jgi:hypothetical protein
MDEMHSCHYCLTSSDVAAVLRDHSCDANNLDP